MNPSVVEVEIYDRALYEERQVGKRVRYEQKQARVTVVWADKDGKTSERDIYTNLARGQQFAREMAAA